MQKTISIFLSLLLLSSATGIAYGQHFCGDHLMKASLTFTGVVESCGMEKHQTPPCGKEDHELHKKDCCNNELHQVETDDNFSGSHFEFSVDKNFVFAFASVFVLRLSFDRYQNPEITRYFPPPIDKDLRVLYQTFRI